MGKTVVPAELFPAGEWFKVDAVCKAIEVPRQTFYRWRSEGKGPRAHRIGGQLRFSGESLNEWLAEQLED